MQGASGEREEIWQKVGWKEIQGPEHIQKSILIFWVYSKLFGAQCSTSHLSFLVCCSLFYESIPQILSINLKTWGLLPHVTICGNLDLNYKQKKKRVYVTSIIDVLTFCFQSAANCFQSLLLIIIALANLESVVIFIISHEFVNKPFGIDGICKFNKQIISDWFFFIF